MSKEKPTLREAAVIEGIREVYDPEIPVNVFDIGLIYKVDEQTNGDVHIAMTLTSPNCPVATILPGQVHRAAERALHKFNGSKVGSVKVALVWTPAFNLNMMPDEIRLLLGL